MFVRVSGDSVARRPSAAHRWRPDGWTTGVESLRKQMDEPENQRNRGPEGAQRSVGIDTDTLSCKGMGRGEHGYYSALDAAIPRDPSESDNNIIGQIKDLMLRSICIKWTMSSLRSTEGERHSTT